MVTGPTSNQFTQGFLHNVAGAYWCGDCHTFVLDCLHLVAPIDAPRVVLNNWLIVAVKYSRALGILELEMNNADGFQFYGVPRSLAVRLVKSEAPAKVYEDEIKGKFRFERVRKC